MVWGMALVCLAFTQLAAEQLPIKSYTTADGLVYNSVKRIFQDSRSFLWFATSGGLSRFDGRHFTNYDSADGLSYRSINDLIETRQGVYWVATNGGGVCRFNPEAGASALFTPYRIGETPTATRVNKLFEDRAGRIWAATDGGLFRLDHSTKDAAGAFVAVKLEMAAHEDRMVQVWAMAEDGAGNLWIATSFGLVRRSPDGRMTHHAVQPSAGKDLIWTLLMDEDGRLWLGHQTAGLVFFAPSQLRNADLGLQLAEARRYTTADGLASDDIRSLCRTADGHLWIGTTNGVTEFDGQHFRSFTKKHGLNDNLIMSLAADRASNLWIGTTFGVMKLARSGFVTYHETDGLGYEQVLSVFTDRAGTLYAISGNWRVNRFDGGRFVSVRFNLPARITDAQWRFHRSIIQDHLGEWWVATGEGLYRFASVSRIEELAAARPKAVYTVLDGLVSNDVSQLYEDSHGDLWMGTFSPGQQVLTRWERATGRFRPYSSADGLPAFNGVNAFGEDAAGTLWVGFREGGLARFVAGRFSLLTAADGLPASGIQNIYRDRNGPLWIGSEAHGLSRIDDPSAAHPRIVRVTQEGVISPYVSMAIEDGAGQVYFGTDRGLNRLTLATDGIKHYTIADGLGGGRIYTAFQDRQGALWFGTAQGLSRFVPLPDPPSAPPPVFISRLRVAGTDRHLFALGQREVSGLTLEPHQNQLEIDFFSFSLNTGETLRYQTKLEGLARLEGQAGDWSAPADGQAVNLRLSPGAYRFLVRAVGADGIASQAPATVSFRILRPVWQRWWFLTLAGLAAASLLLGFARYRQLRTNELKAALSESRKLTEELTVQETALRLANQTLSLETAVTHILAEATTPTEAAPKILHAICESTGWHWGAIWNVDAAASVLRCAAVWPPSGTAGLPFEAETRTKVFAPGEGLPGRVWASGQSHWITDLAQDANFPRLSAAVKEGLRSGFGFPILLGSEVIAVLEFFSRELRASDQDQIQMMTAIGSHIGQLVERRRAEEAKRESETRFRTLAETASDAIITIDETGTIIFVNPAVEKIFGHAADKLIGQDMTMLMPEYLRHLHEAGFARYKQTGKRHIGWDAIELPGLHRDGREIPLEISFGEFISNDRRLFTGIARDISERKRAAEALEKAREERIVELEQVRRRIATDLHDDIGSSLTQISILSEVLRQRFKPATGTLPNASQQQVNEPLKLIASASRELVDSMSDIVWAINPQKDHLSDLTRRMLTFASDTFIARNIAFDFRAPDEAHDIRLGASLRREVFLIFKESVNNLAKHSGCTEADIEFQINADALTLVTRDNGAGFDLAERRDGHGLQSMRERAEALGGSFQIVSEPGLGTAVTLSVPLNG
ncbi:MAG: two-component regulator propeller domain-containing protein [Acidobacteriota bacterium]